jgi:hypothetical protein
VVGVEVGMRVLWLIPMTAVLISTMQKCQIWISVRLTFRGVPADSPVPTQVCRTLETTLTEPMETLARRARLCT